MSDCEKNYMREVRKENQINKKPHMEPLRQSSRKKYYKSYKWKNKHQKEPDKRLPAEALKKYTIPTTYAQINVWGISKNSQSPQIVYYIKTHKKTYITEMLDLSSQFIHVPITKYRSSHWNTECSLYWCQQNIQCSESLNSIPWSLSKSVHLPSLGRKLKFQQSQKTRNHYKASTESREFNKSEYNWRLSLKFQQPTKYTSTSPFSAERTEKKASPIPKEVHENCRIPSLINRIETLE